MKMKNLTLASGLKHRGKHGGFAYNNIVIATDADYGRDAHTFITHHFFPSVFSGVDQRGTFVYLNTAV